MSDKLQVINQQLDAAKTLKSMLSLPVVADRFIANYHKTTGKKDGQQRFEQEVFNFVELANDNPKIKDCTNFSKFAAIVKAGTTGLSFKDGHLYPIPYGKVLKVRIGAHGKREMLMRMPTIKFVDEAQLILKGDEFTYDKSKGLVLGHISDFMKAPAITFDNILGSYCRITFADGSVKDVLLTKEEIIKAKSKSKTDAIWKEFPGEMSKKTSYGRAFKLYHRYPEGEFDLSAFEDNSDDEITPIPINEETPAPEQPAPEETNAEESPKEEETKKESSADDMVSDAEIIEEKKDTPPKLEGF